MFGRRTEVRTDAKLVVLALVANIYGFIKILPYRQVIKHELTSFSLCGKGKPVSVWIIT